MSYLKIKTDEFLGNDTIYECKQVFKVPLMQVNNFNYKMDNTYD